MIADLKSNTKSYWYIFKKEYSSEAKIFKKRLEITVLSG